VGDIVFSHNGSYGAWCGNIDVGAVLQQVVKISNVFTRGARGFGFVVVHNGSKLGEV